MTQQPHRQRGSTLLVAMIFLVLISLFAISAYKSTSSHQRVVGNMQARQEAIAVAQQAIEQTISSNPFITKPSLVALAPTAGNLGGPAVTDLTASLSPVARCIRSRVIRSNELEIPTDPTLPNPDAGCVSSGKDGNPDSLCELTEWDVSAQVTDPRTGASVSVHQGVSVRMLVTDADSVCPQ